MDQEVNLLSQYTKKKIIIRGARLEGLLTKRTTRGKEEGEEEEQETMVGKSSAVNSKNSDIERQWRQGRKEMGERRGGIRRR